MINIMIKITKKCHVEIGFMGNFGNGFGDNSLKIIPHCYKNLFKVRVMCGTAEFIAPEIVAYDNVCGATDMWAIGIFTFQ